MVSSPTSAATVWAWAALAISVVPRNATATMDDFMVVSIMGFPAQSGRRWGYTAGKGADAPHSEFFVEAASKTGTPV
ncbi:hypothetical protein MAE02_02050 [Microvirga aerophila]|uniref:Uncharacterized protein n=1 Tax=Microvirga aerophila TaxID=670291 RepID=A0A512BKK2_9HYPH|nr:hypothetical protein MAE02_02050 [Microvirga aerophila]